MKKQGFVFIALVLLLGSGCSESLSQEVSKLFHGGGNNNPPNVDPTPPPAPPAPPQLVTQSFYGRLQAPNASAPLDIVVSVDLAGDTSKVANIQSTIGAFVSGLQSASVDFHLGFIDSSTHSGAAANPALVGSVIASTDSNPSTEASTTLGTIQSQEQSEVYSDPTANLVAAVELPGNTSFFRPEAYRMYLMVTASTQSLNSGTVSTGFIPALDNQAQPRIWRLFSVNDNTDGLDCFSQNAGQDSIELAELSTASGGSNFCGISTLAQAFSSALGSVTEERSEVSFRNLVIPNSSFSFDSYSVGIDGTDWTANINFNWQRSSFNFTAGSLPSADAPVDFNFVASYYQQQ